MFSVYFTTVQNRVSALFSADYIVSIKTSVYFTSDILRPRGPILPKIYLSTRQVANWLTSNCFSNFFWRSDVAMDQKGEKKTQ